MGEKKKVNKISKFHLNNLYLAKHQSPTPEKNQPQPDTLAQDRTM